jgi:hypothetical protein
VARGPSPEFVDALCEEIESGFEWEQVAVAAAAHKVGVAVNANTYRSWKKIGEDNRDLDPTILSERERACVNMVVRVGEAELLSANKANRQFQKYIHGDNRNAGRFLDFMKARYKHVREGGQEAQQTIVIVREAPAKDKVDRP